MKTILIVEETELNIDLLTQILEDEYTLIVARDGATGVAMAEENRPDLVLMDIAMPVMDGYEAARRIREKSPALPILGVSSHAMTGDAERAKAAGCNDYVTKPIDEDVLLQKIHGLLE